MTGIKVLVNGGEDEIYLDDKSSQHYTFVTNGVLQVYAKVFGRDQLVASYAPGRWVQAVQINE